jgi:hypothetical protein
MPSPPIQIHGYAIVSDDDRIAGADGVTPPSLRNNADWAYFQRELDRADLVALGRLGHEANPNVKGRRRLVLSSHASGLERHGDAWWWSPAQTSWHEAAATLLPNGGRVVRPLSGGRLQRVPSHPRPWRAAQRWARVVCGLRPRLERRGRP